METGSPNLIDLNAETAKLTMFRGRTPTTSFAERRGTAALLGPYRDGMLLLSKSAGTGHWEIHPADELLYVLDGEMGVDIVGRDGPRSFTAGAGIIAVVPAGAWHRVYSAEGMVVASATIPGGHVDLDIADPRPHLPPQGDRDDKPPSLIDLGAELAKVTMYRRSPHSTAADRKGSVAQLDTYRDGLLLAIKASGKDHWERHATGDELVCVVDGAATLEMVCDSGPPRSFALGAGTVGVIPQGAWHRFQSAEGFTQIAVTPFPGETVERDVDDPRGVESRVI